MKITLNPELTSTFDQVVKVSNGNVQKDIEFDDAGTVHIMYRDNDGKLLKDVALSKEDEPISDPVQDFVKENEESYNSAIIKAKSVYITIATVITAFMLLAVLTIRLIT